MSSTTTLWKLPQMSWFKLMLITALLLLRVDPSWCRSTESSWTTTNNEKGDTNSGQTTDEDEDEATTWDTIFGVLMYFPMVLFFGLQIALLIFCLGYFIKKMWSGTDDQSESSGSNGNTNLGLSPDETNSLDEKSIKILNNLKDPNSKEILVFSLAPDSPLVNNWVKDGIETQSWMSIDTPKRRQSVISVLTVDSSVPDSATPYSPKWTCIICMRQKEDEATIKLPCSHSYHKTCLKDFVIYSLEHSLAFKCPLCRCPFNINLDFKNDIKQIEMDNVSE